MSGADARAARSLVDRQLRRGPAPLALPAPASVPLRGAWQQIGGDGKGWAAGEFYKVRGLAWQRGRLYASVSGPATDGPRGEIWAWDGASWERLATPWDGGSSFVEHLFVHDERLYAAERGGVWVHDRGQWHALRDEVTVAGVSGPYAFGSWRGDVAVTFWGAPAVMAHSSNGWRRLPDPAGGWGESVRTVYCVHEHGGALYAGTGTGKFVGPGPAVWRFDGRAWEKIAGGGVRGSWSQGGIPFVLSMTTYGGMLIATTSRPPSTPPQATNIWAFDDAQWHPVGAGKVPELMARSLIANDSAAYESRLIVATGDGKHRDAEVWQLQADHGWRAIGAGAFRSQGAEGAGGYWVYKLCAAGDALFAGTAGHRGAARVFRFSQ